jgi:hypothetical protein
MLLAASFCDFENYFKYSSHISEQGCQIFLGTTYQNGEKYTKGPQNLPNVH